LFSLSEPVTTEETIRQSRFVTHAAPVEDRNATLAFFNRVADPAASHNCWAWKLENDYRFNDDGEPSSTAGKPILAAIEGKLLCHVMIVVTRYFGGTKLGIGGLIRAYSGCAARCLDRGRIVKTQTMSQCVIEAGFEWTGQVHNLLEASEVIRHEDRFTASGMFIRFEIREDRLQKLQIRLRDATRGNAILKKL